MGMLMLNAECSKMYLRKIHYNLDDQIKKYETHTESTCTHFIVLLFVLCYPLQQKWSFSLFASVFSCIGAVGQLNTLSDSILGQTLFKINLLKQKTQRRH